MSARTFIATAMRTAVVPRNGKFAALSIHELATPVIRRCLEHTGVAVDVVDQLVCGNALGAGGNPARLVSLAAGLPERVSGISIDTQCCSGLDAIMLASSLVQAGQAEIVIAGGVESYSTRPVRMRRFADGRAPEAYEQAAFTPWPQRDPDMVDAAESLAQHLKISKLQQDRWAMDSHRKALQYQKLNSREIVTLNGVTSDPFTRTLSSALCSRAKQLQGSISAANMSVAADAAAFCIVVGERTMRTLQQPGVEIIASANTGANPELPGLAPVAAIQQVLVNGNCTLPGITQAEVMEAFAAQAIACTDESGLDKELVNIHGGSLARGHPIGASGAILATALYHSLVDTDKRGIAAIAAAGGIGSAMLFQGVASK